MGVKRLISERVTGNVSAVEVSTWFKKPVMVLKMEVEQLWEHRTKSYNPAKLYKYTTYKKTVLKNATHAQVEKMVLSYCETPFK